MDWMLVLIQKIDYILFYFMPGYICIYLFKLFRGSSRNDNNIIVIESIAISYIIQLIYKRLFEINELEGFKDHIIILVSSVLISYLLYTALRIGIIDKLSEFLKINRSVSSNIIDSCIDVNYGTWVTVYIKDEKIIYQGQMRKWESVGSKSDIFIALSNYCSYGYDGEDVNLFEDNNGEWVLLNTKNISRIEVSYHPNSKLICNKDRLKPTKEKEYEDKIF